VRVLQVLHDGRLGGPQWRIVQVAKALRSQGISTHVLFPFADHDFPRLLEDAGVSYECPELVRLRATRRPDVHAKWATMFLPNVRTIQKVIETRKIDVVHVNGLMNIQGSLAARRCGVPLLWHLNDESTPRQAVRVLRQPLERWPAVIAISAPALRPAYGLDGSAASPPVHVLFPPVDPVRFSRPITPPVSRSEFGIPDDALVVGTVGNLNPTKGTDIFLEALAAARRVEPALFGVIVGPELSTRKAFAARLRDLAASSPLSSGVRFLGRRLDVERVLAILDFYAQASRSEGVGMAAMEASAMGLPVIASASGGLVDVVDDGVTGALVEPADVGALSEAMVKLSADEPLRRQMGINGAQKMAGHTPEAAARSHVTAYEAALSS